MTQPESDKQLVAISDFWIRLWKDDFVRAIDDPNLRLHPSPFLENPDKNIQKSA
jgi:hypothetical protein